MVTGVLSAPFHSGGNQGENLPGQADVLIMPFFYTLTWGFLSWDSELNRFLKKGKGKFRKPPGILTLVAFHLTGV